MRYFIVILTLFFVQPLMALEGVILSGKNRIKVSGAAQDNFVLIERQKITLKNQDTLKTRAKGYIFTEHQGLKVLIHPFSEVRIIDSTRAVYELLKGEIWLENPGGVVNLIQAGGHQLNSVEGMVRIRYQRGGIPEEDRITVTTLEGVARALVAGQGFNLVNYQILKKDEGQKPQLRRINIEEMQGYIYSYENYRRKISGWQHSELQRDKFLFRMGGNLEYVSQGEKTYIMAAAKPQFKYKSWRWGLILPISVDKDNSQGYKPEQWGNYSEWNFESFGDSLSDLALKLDFVTYGDKNSPPLYVNAGNISKVGIGNNLIMSSFKPNLNYPQRRQLTVESGYLSDSWGIDAFMADFSSLEIWGSRGYYKPFVDHYLFKKLEIGASLVADIDPRGDNLSSGSGTVFFLGLDLNLPLYNFSELMTFNFRSEYTMALYSESDGLQSARGFGYSYGLKGEILDIFDYSFGGIVLKDRFPDSYFDSRYLVSRRDKFDYLSSSRSANDYGIYGALAFDLDNLFKIDFSYREVLDTRLIEDRPNNKFSFSFYLYPSFMDYVYMVISYDRLGIKNFDEFWENFFTSEFNSIEASLRLPFKLKYLEFQLNFRRSVLIDQETESVKNENAYESQVKFLF